MLNLPKGGRKTNRTGQQRPSAGKWAEEERKSLYSSPHGAVLRANRQQPAQPAQPAASKASAATARKEASWPAGNGSAERKGSSPAHRTRKKKKVSYKKCRAGVYCGGAGAGVNLGPGLGENRISGLVHRFLFFSLLLGDGPNRFFYSR